MKTLKEILPRTVIVLAVMAIAVAVAGILTGCASTKPQPTTEVTAYNYFAFEPNSRANVMSGTQGSQGNAIHAGVNSPMTNRQKPSASKKMEAVKTLTAQLDTALQKQKKAQQDASEDAGKLAEEVESLSVLLEAALQELEASQQVAISDDAKQMAEQQAALFGNIGVGDRTADVAASNAIELLRNVRGSSAGQSTALTRGDDSPADSQQSQTPTQTENRNRTLNVPVSVSQQGAVAQTGTTPTATEQAIPAVFELAIKQAKSPVTAAQKAAIDSAIAADTDNAVPAGLDMTLAEWRTLKAAYIECPECLGGLTDAERAALKAATGK
jgi:hypothetical protein